MRVLLINPQGSWVSYEGDLGAGDRDYGDFLGIRYIAAVARDRGHDAEILDAQFEHRSDEDVRSWIRAAAEQPADVIGLSAIEHTISATVSCAELCRELFPSAHIVIGGYAATFWWEDLLARVPALDSVVVGEGEATFGALLDALDEGDEWRGLDGLAARDASGCAQLNPARPLRELDSLAWPVRDESYPRGYANILSSRGCYGHCTFCSIIQFYGKSPGEAVRVRDPEDLVAEIASLVDRGVRHIDFVDDNFVSGAKTSGWVDAFVAALSALPERPTLGFQLRPDDVEREMLAKLKSVGLRFVSIGVESDLDARLRLFGKHTDKARNRHALEIVRGLGLETYIEILLFHPEVTLEEIAENLAFMQEVEYWRSVRVIPATWLYELQLYRGIPLLQHYRRAGLVDDKPDGWGHVWRYRDESIPVLRARLRQWRQLSERVANHHLAYYQYPLAAAGDSAGGLRSMKLSRRFLRHDLEVFTSILTDLSAGGSDAAFQDILEAQRSVLEEFEEKFEDLAARAGGWRAFGVRS